ncbi:hypothetical protein BKD26_36475 [Streptomyces sp. CB03238]|nr:hypothetical protein BKD26_36475 [Streptomyces sp. CB03238]
MTARQTTMSAPVHLTIPPSPPVPAPGCRVCAALDKQRAEARDRGDFSAVTDANVELASHPESGSHSHKRRK